MRRYFVYAFIPTRLRKPMILHTCSRTCLNSVKLAHGCTESTQTARIEKQLANNITEVEGRLLFVQSSPAGFQGLLRQLDKSESQVKQATKDEIRRIERFDILNVEEQIAGFSSTWKDGRAELVMH